MQIENLLFILLIAMALLFKLLASKVGDAKKREQDPDRTPATRPSGVESIERAPVESDAERIRRFLEALGQPTGSRPPPPVVPRTDIPPRPLAPVKPPTAHVLTPWKLTREERRKRHVILQETPVVRPPVIESQERQVQIEPPSDTKLPEGADATPADSKIKTAYAATDIAGFLHSSTGQRNAIILREIFGPPRSLQPLDLVGSA
jgi:hypothetical protein